jgi:hypothetical protein
VKYFSPFATKMQQNFCRSISLFFIIVFFRMNFLDKFNGSVKEEEASKPRTIALIVD